MAARTLIAACAATLLTAGAAAAQETPDMHWSFDGLFGTFDRGALQRGFQIYNEVCSTCHSMHQMYYRNLTEIGFTEDQVKNIAASKEVEDGPDDEGKMFTRPGRPSDRFKPPFPNAKAAAFSNNGATPPDLSLIVKAREGGANHVFGVLTGYKQPAPPPEDSACKETRSEKQPNGETKTVVTAPEVREGQYYNAAMPGCVIAMPPPLQDDSVKFADGTPATLQQEAHDIATFLAWTAEPELETRHRLGVKVLLFLFVLTGLMFAVKKKIWQDVKH